MGILTNENESYLANGRGIGEMKQPMGLTASTFNTGQSVEYRGIISAYGLAANVTKNKFFSIDTNSLCFNYILNLTDIKPYET